MSILLINTINFKKVIFVVSKFTSSIPLEEYADLVTATKAFPNLKEKHLYFISKFGYTTPVIKQAKLDNATLLTIDDLFKI